MVYRFAECELDEQLYQLRRNGVLVPVEPKVFDVLVYLLQQRNRVVSKDELLDKLWPGQVIGENALTRCIRAARAAVGDDGTKQEIIETQHGRGYRFIAPLTSSPPVPGSTFQVPCLESRSQESEVRNQKENGQQTTGRQRETTIDQEIATAKPRRVRPAHQLALGLALLVSILVTVQYLSLPTSNPQFLTPNSQPALPLPDEPSILVLPFVNLSGDPSQEYFSDGMTEEITNSLSRIASLFVISRTSAFSYKGKQTNIQAISKEMGVRYVLEGSVRKVNDQVRITTQLIDATTGYLVWSERYDRALHDIFAVHDELRDKIVFALKVKVTPEEQARFRRAPTANLEAYDYYLRGMEFFWRAYYETKKEANEQARQRFEQAIALDSQYAGAYAGLGVTYWLDWFSLWSANPAQSLGQAAELAQKAIGLDDSLSLPHRVLGGAYVWKKQHDQAVAEGERALALDPNDADAHETLAGILIFAGRPEEVPRLIEKAMRLNPQYPPSYLLALGFAYRVMGRYEEALLPLTKVLPRAPNHIPTHIHLAVCYAELGREQEAQAEVAEILRINPHFSLAWVQRTVPYKDPRVLERFLASLRKAGLK